jgi:hypothetical protein
VDPSAALEIVGEILSWAATLEFSCSVGGAAGEDNTAFPCLGVVLWLPPPAPGRARPRLGVEGVPASDRGDPGKEELGGELLVFLGGGSFKSAGVSPTFTTIPGTPCADGGTAGTVANVEAEWLTGMDA